MYSFNLQYLQFLRWGSESPIWIIFAIFVISTDINFAISAISVICVKGVLNLSFGQFAISATSAEYLQYLQYH